MNDPGSILNAEALLVHSDWLRALALSLVRGESEWIEVPVGATGVLLHLARGARLAGSLVVDEGVPLDQIKLRLSGKGFARFIALQDDASFEVHGLEAGSCDLEVLFAGTMSPIVQIGDVRVPSSGKVEDARLRGIDLRGKLALLRLRLRDARKRWIRDEMVCVIPDRQGGEPSWCSTDREGRAQLLAKEVAPHHLVFLSGWRLVRTRLSSEEQLIQLEPGIPVQLLLPQEALRLDETCSVSIQLVSRRLAGCESPVQLPSSEGDRVEDCRMGLSVPAPGDYEVQWTLLKEVRAEGESLIERRPVTPDGPPQIVTVSSGTEPQVIPVSITREQLERAMKD